MNGTSAVKRVLVADADAAIRQSVVSFVSARGYLVEQSDNCAEAASLLLSQRVDVLVADVAVDNPGGLELLAIAKRVAPSTRSVVIGKDLSRAEHEGATRLGAVRVLHKPLSLLDLGDAVDLAAACAEGFHGWLHGLSLPDVLQMFHMTGASLTLRVRGAAEGRLVFHAGNIVHAECEAESGRAALARLLAVRAGQLETAAAEMTAPTISERFEEVVLDSLRIVDESRRRPSVAPTTNHPSGEFSFAGLFDETRRRPTWRPSALRPENDRTSAMRRSLAQHAPGAFAWLCDLSSGRLERVDEWESPSDLGMAVRAFGIALALAECSDGAWTSVELTYGGFAVGLARRGRLVLAVARAAMGEDVLRRFRVEITQLRRYWLSEADAA